MIHNAFIKLKTLYAFRGLQVMFILFVWLVPHYIAKCIQCDVVILQKCIYSVKAKPKRFNADQITCAFKKNKKQQIIASLPWLCTIKRISFSSLPCDKINFYMLCFFKIPLHWLVTVCTHEHNLDLTWNDEKNQDF